MLVLPQDVHERFLEKELKRAGVLVERNCELLDFEQRNDSILARLGTTRGEETASFEYLCGCEGAQSSVREKCGISFPRGTCQPVVFGPDASGARPTADHDVRFSLTRPD